MSTHLLFKHRANPLVHRLISKIIGCHRSIYQLNQDLPDRIILEQLQRLIVRRAFDPMVRANQRARDVVALVADHQVDNLLDVGAGDGIVTEAIGRAFGLTRPNIAGTDIPGWLDNDDVLRGDIEFQPSTETIPYQNRSLIVSLMTLHHIPEVQHMLRRIHEALAEDGLLVIREHDASTQLVHDLIDLEHYLYLALSGQLAKLSEYYGLYRSRTEWTELLVRSGFQLVRITEPYGPTRYYYAVYRKLGSSGSSSS